MKVLRLCLLLIILSTTFCNAQFHLIEAAAGLGYNVNNTVTDHHVSGNRGGMRAIVSGGVYVWPTISLGAMYEQNKWGYSSVLGNVELANPARAFSVYGTKHFRLRNFNRFKKLHSEFNIKVNVGYTTINRGSPYVQRINYGYKNNFKGNGPNTGINLELVYPVIKFISVFGTLGVNEATIDGTNNQRFLTYNIDKHIYYRLFYYTAAAGVTVRF